ncbi:hypothetical protein MMC27_007597 [Xylographa pallens]|nr:hypothetical protein [Xylographa pallens]
MLPLIEATNIGHELRKLFKAQSVQGLVPTAQSTHDILQTQWNGITSKDVVMPVEVGKGLGLPISSISSPTGGDGLGSPAVSTMGVDRATTPVDSASQVDVPITPHRTTPTVPMVPRPTSTEQATAIPNGTIQRAASSTESSLPHRKNIRGSGTIRREVATEPGKPAMSKELKWLDEHKGGYYEDISQETEKGDAERAIGKANSHLVERHSEAANPMSTPIPKIVLGAGSIGASADAQAHFTNVEDAQAFLNLFRSYGHVDIDTARGYSPGAPGTSEQILGQTDYKQWAIIDTKVKSGPPNAHTKDNVAESIQQSLSALKVDKVHVQYLHMPDRTTSFEETCEAMNTAFVAGKFEKFGLSNFNPDEVEQVVAICKKNGWVRPSVYQGHYNAITRLSEDKLLPTLRKHGLAYYVYSPSGGGIFSGKVNKDSIVPGGRFDSNSGAGKLYRSLYLKEELLAAAQRVHDEAQKQGLTGQAAALRWVLHHSALNAKYGDAMIIGASSLRQLEENLVICKGGPLPDDVVKVIEGVWQSAKPFAPWAHM